ncbi:MAG: hypothetical protein ACXVCP_19785 [Bdellovibrio sp.]
MSGSVMKICLIYLSVIFFGVPLLAKSDSNPDTLEFANEVFSLERSRSYEAQSRGDYGYYSGPLNENEPVQNGQAFGTPNSDELSRDPKALAEHLRVPYRPGMTVQDVREYYADSIGDQLTLEQLRKQRYTNRNQYRSTHGSSSSCNSVFDVLRNW